MSATATPITPERFAAALRALPLSAVHAKVAELRNSAAHLRRSNAELYPLAVAGDVVCYEAYRENEEVLARLAERVELCRREVVELRAMPWVEEEEKKEEETKEGEDGVGQTATDGTTTDDAAATAASSTTALPTRPAVPAAQTNGNTTTTTTTTTTANNRDNTESEGVFL